MTDISSLTFEGKSGVECETFIVTIRKHAFAVGKADDAKWIAQLAASCFTSDALRWHAAVEASIRENWDELQQAMLLKWPKNSYLSPPTP